MIEQEFQENEVTTEAMQPPSHEEQKVRDAVRELRVPILKMLEPIMENIKDGDYQLLIGDDASGRVPTLIVRKVINDIYVKKGISSIPTRFIAGTRFFEKGKSDSDKKMADVSAYIKELLASIPNLKNALIVTDTIYSGKSLTPVAHSLRESGISFDIVTVGTTYDFHESQPEIEENLGGPIFTGMNYTPAIYSKHNIAGVYKHPEDLHSFPATSVENLHMTTDSIQNIISIARDEANQVAKDILNDIELGKEGSSLRNETFVDEKQ